MDTTFVNMGDILKKTILVTESPIESALLGSLKKFGVQCFPQFPIGPYRADILIDSKYRQIVVECDGKEFHTDKEKDANRDKYMQDKGFAVVRFTGSEINADPDNCAMKIIEHISEVYSSPKYQEFLEKHLARQVCDDEPRINDDMLIN